MYNKFQYIVLEMVKEKTLTQVQTEYFTGFGIGYLQRVMAGKACPYKLIMEAVLKHLPEEWHKKYEEYVAYEKSFKGW